MTRALPVERRAIALLRTRRTLVGVGLAGGLGIAVAFALALDRELRADAIFEVIAYVSALVPLILGHGMVSADLRSGVAMLWLQKPVRPVWFFVRRVIEVTALAVVLVLAVWGVGAALVGVSAGPASAGELLAAAPGMVLIVVCVCTLTFAFSAWGTPADSLLVVAFFSVGTLSLLLGGRLAAALEWIVLPIEAIGAFARGLAGSSSLGPGEAALRIGRFLSIWGTVGILGLAVSTRSPLPREVAR